MVDRDGDSTGLDHATEHLLSTRPRRPYSPVERAGLVWLAIRDGVTATSQRYGVSRRTLTEWLEEVGGAAQVRAWLQEQTLADFLRAERSIYHAVATRADDLPNDDLMMTFRKLVESRLGLAVEGAIAGGGGAPAGAAAQATVTVTVKGDGGADEVIEVHQ